MRAIAAILLLACAAAAVACSGDASRPSGDERSARDQTAAAMAALGSYRVEMELGAGEPIVIEYQKPNSYRSMLIANDNQTGRRTLGELLYVGDTIYARKCDPDGTTCGAWDTTDRSDVIVGAASPSYFPQWPLVALEMATDVRSATDGGSIRISGSVNHIRAVFENSRRLTEAAGITSVSQECSSGAAATPIGLNEGEQSSPPVATNAQDHCRDLTYEEELQNQEPTLSFYDEHPATLEVEVDPETQLVERITVTIIEANYDAGVSEQSAAPRSFTFTYSKFDGVTIEAPVP